MGSFEKLPTRLCDSLLGMLQLYVLFLSRSCFLSPTSGGFRGGSGFGKKPPLSQDHLSRDARKPVFGVYDQV